MDSTLNRNRSSNRKSSKIDLDLKTGKNNKVYKIKTEIKIINKCKTNIKSKIEIKLFKMMPKLKIPRLLP